MQVGISSNDASDTRPVLMIDCNNLYIRHYVVNPDMSSNGMQVGGIVGSLKAIRRVMSELAPKKIIVVWEGGGSTKRRAIASDYKASRRPARLNRFYEDDIPDTDDNRVWQMAVLARLIGKLPLKQVYVQDCEGDDVIAYLSRTHFKNDRKVILSNDRDYYQLLDDKTSVYSPQSKRLHTLEDVKREYYGILPKNFALAKALCGDKSDNIKGVQGLGFKTLVARVPIMASDKEVTIDDVLDYSRVRSSEAKVMKSIAESESVIRTNWRLVYLGGTTLNNEQERKVDSILADTAAKMDTLGFMREVMQAGIRSIENPYDFCSAFIPLTKVET